GFPGMRSPVFPLWNIVRLGPRAPTDPLGAAERWPRRGSAPSRALAAAAPRLTAPIGRRRRGGRPKAHTGARATIKAHETRSTLPVPSLAIVTAPAIGC